jgi:hypothetical protein
MIIYSAPGYNVTALFDVSQFKAFEITLHYRPSLGLCFDGHVTLDGDHPGFFFTTLLFGIGFSFSFYDSRHEEDFK